MTSRNQRGGVYGQYGWRGMSATESGESQLGFAPYGSLVQQTRFLKWRWVFRMQRNVEQWYAIKFYVKQNKSATETLTMLQEAYGNDSLSSAQMFRWQEVFKDGRENVDDEQHTERPSSSRTLDNVLKALLDSGRLMNIRIISEMLGITKLICIKSSRKSFKCRKFVPSFSRCPCSFPDVHVIDTKGTFHKASMPQG